MFRRCNRRKVPNMQVGKRESSGIQNPRIQESAYCGKQTIERYPNVYANAKVNDK